MTRSRLLASLLALASVAPSTVFAPNVARADDPEPEVSDQEEPAESQESIMHRRWDRLIGIQLSGAYENGPYGILGGSVIIQPHRLFRIDLGGGGSRDGARVGGGIGMTIPQDHFALVLRIGFAGGPLNWVADQQPSNTRHWDFAAFMNGEIGLEYRFDEGVLVRFDVGVETTITAPANSCTQAAPDGLPVGGLCAAGDNDHPARVFFGLSVGYMFDVTLGAAPEPAPEPVVEAAPGDADGDGLTDDVDGCPSEPEDVDGFEDADGCPDPDNDQDGVLDGADGAPLDPEDRDGFEDTDGVPDPDNDQDGVLDGADGAPLDPEDRDGFEDTDGVPDPDNDHDTVLDAEDECPLTPGTVAARGCSESVRLDTETGSIIILQRVEFASGGDVILDSSFPILQEVAGVLAANPQLTRVRIEGHTDDRGRDPANLDLSRRRAASVRTWMAAHGVAAERLEGWGCGELHPIETNTTAAGRQANRRVEFHIVSPPPPGGAREIAGCVSAE